jgi:methyltransferase (TIGR00027 family)
MRAEQVSVTAQRVAAHRLLFDRAPAPWGDPRGDDQLARDVAAAVHVRPGLMREYLRARTRFFDVVVTTVLGRGCAQAVLGAAGYDGRALRYAKPGVRWFEVDHPATQEDKRARLRRLGIGCDHVTFVAADFARDPVADLLVSAGLAAGLPTLFLLEGVAAYLEIPVLRALLGQLRSVAADGSRLAISAPLSRISGETGRISGEQAALRAATVAAVGEPFRSVPDPGHARGTLEAAGWQPMEPAGVDRPDAPGRSRSTGFVLARPSPAGEESSGPTCPR